MIVIVGLAMAPEYNGNFFFFFIRLFDVALMTKYAHSHSFKKAPIDVQSSCNRIKPRNKQKKHCPCSALALHCIYLQCSFRCEVCICLLFFLFLCRCRCCCFFFCSFARSIIMHSRSITRSRFAAKRQDIKMH